MSIPQNPANTRLARDIKFYRRKISTPPASDPTAPAEIRGHLTKKEPGQIPPNAPNNNDILTGNAYKIFASWPSKTAKPIPNRLGGRLDKTTPTHLNGLPPPTGSSITFTPSNHPPVTVNINPDGSVLHKDPVTGLEIHAAHHYMHAIFDHILYEIRDLLEAINDKLEKYADVVSVANPAAAEAAAYSAAVVAFEDYVASLQQPGLNPVTPSPYAPAFNFVGVSPVVTNEGFIVSCRVKLTWKNPYHSSSSIAIP